MLYWLALAMLYWLALAMLYWLVTLYWLDKKYYPLWKLNRYFSIGNSILALGLPALGLPALGSEAELVVSFSKFASRPLFSFLFFSFLFFFFRWEGGGREMETRLATIPVLSTQHSITLEKSIRLFHKVRVLVFFFSVMLVLDRCFAHSLFAHNLFAHTSFVHNFLFFFPSFLPSFSPSCFHFSHSLSFSWKGL